jgi:hypothetical protein
MPKATVSTESFRVELKSLPGGFVALKQLPFGQMLQRRDKAARFLQEMGAPGSDAPNKMQIDILNEASRYYDFSHCIVDHNLEDDQGVKLDFSEKMIQMTFSVLDPRIAAEIEREIDKLNREDFDEKGFTSLSEEPSTQTSETT